MNFGTQVMLDLETLGTSSQAAIVSIGAVSITDTGIDRTFYASISLESAMASGGEVEASTILWWLGQSKEAIESTFPEPAQKHKSVLHSFSKWITDIKPDGVWGNGATFDNVILSNAYKRENLLSPWSYRIDRCYRTLATITDVPKPVTAGIKHYALDDATFQAFHLLAIWKQKGF